MLFQIIVGRDICTTIPTTTSWIVLVLVLLHPSSRRDNGFRNVRRFGRRRSTGTLIHGALSLSPSVLLLRTDVVLQSFTRIVHSTRFDPIRFVCVKQSLFLASHHENVLGTAS